MVTGQVNFRVYRRDEAGVYQLYFNRVVQQDMVTSLFRDDRGRAWVGTTRGGALLFDRDRKEFVAYDRAACGIASDYVSAISQTPSGLMVAAKISTSATDFRCCRSRTAVCGAARGTRCWRAASTASCRSRGRS